MGDNQEQLTLFSIQETNEKAPKEKKVAIRKERKREQQPNMFASSYEKPNFPKHIRLIEFFAGIGAQAKALEILNADFEHWRTCEWSWQSITAYNAIHMGERIEDTSSLSYDDVISRIKGVSNNYNQPMSEAQLRKKGEKWARELLGRMIANRNVCPNVSALHAEDLDIRERERNTYVLTYSFPCTDLSNAGQMKGMAKGSGTRSGLLWEVERILLECKELDCLPQVLVMENVPNVIGANNVEPFNQWLDALHRMGYTNYYEIMNAADYAIPQSRNRCFMVSVLGQYSFEFPRPMPLKYLIKDFISSKVDESYYLPDEMVEDFHWYFMKMPKTQLSCDTGEIKCVCLGNIHAPLFSEMTGRVYSTIGLSPTVRTFCGGGQETKIPVENKEEEMTGEYELSDAMQRYIVSKNGKYIVGKSTLNPTIAKPITTREGQTRADASTYLSPDCPNDCEIVADEDGYPRRKDMETNKRLRIRKLTEGECYRFMGFQRKDYEACVKAGQSKSSIYHQAGDSIVTTCLVGIFGELLGIDYEKAIQDYADGLHKEVSE